MTWFLILSIACLLLEEAQAVPSYIYGNACYATAYSYNFTCFSADNYVQCVCSMDVFLETVAHCIESYSPSDSIAQAGYAFITETCQQYGDVLITESEMVLMAQKAEEAIAINSSYNPTLTDAINAVFNMNTDLVLLNINTYEASWYSDWISQIFGAGILSYFGLVIILKSIHNLFYKAAPKILVFFDKFKLIRFLRKRIFLPASFSMHHSASKNLRGFTLIIPVRSHSLFILGYCILNVVFVFPLYQSYEGEVSGTLASFIGNRTGFLALSQLPLLIVFGGRNNILLWITGWPIDTFNTFHRWVGRIIVIHVLVHALTYTANEALSDYFAQIWEVSYWRWGVAALFGGMIILFQSMHIFRSKKYEIFLIIHIAMAIVFIIGAWYHLEIIGEGQRYNRAAVALWAFDRLIRLVRIGWSGPLSKARMILHNDDIVQMDIDYSGRWQPYPGSFVFIHILRKNKFWESHPFTIVPIPDQKTKFKVFCRVKTGITEVTRKHLSNKPDHESEVRVLLEGPYGPSHPVHHYANVVLLAGGIGVTGIYSYAADLCRRKDLKIRVKLCWVMRDECSISWFFDEIEYLRSDPRFNIQLYISQMGSENDSVYEGEEEKTAPANIGTTPTDENYIKVYRRPIVKEIVQQSIEESTGTLAIVSCGPGTMNDQARQCVAQNLELSSQRVDYFEESFSW
jgi:predicted ferric reductase